MVQASGNPKPPRRGIGIPIALFLLLPLLCLGASAHAVTVWERWGTEISSTNAFASPYWNTKLCVEYTSPTGVLYSGYGFWDRVAAGTHFFRIRASFPEVGSWSWRIRPTLESGCVNDTLFPVAQRQGTMAITAYSGSNPLYSRGPVRVRTSGVQAKRILEHRDGTPFLWQGDTAWFGPYKSTTTAWADYLTGTNGRLGQGFSVIQISVPIGGTGLQGDLAGNSPFLPANCASLGAPPSSGCYWNAPFWNTLDSRIKAANDAGFVVVLIGLMKRALEGGSGGQPWPVLADSVLYARNVAARYSGDHVIFSPGFDGSSPNRADLTGRAGEGPVPASCFDASNPDLLNASLPPSCFLTASGQENQACRARCVGQITARASQNLPARSLLTHHMGGGCNNTPPGQKCTSDYWFEKFQRESWLSFQLFQSGQASGSTGNTQIEQVTQRGRERAWRLYTYPDTAATPTKPNINGEPPYADDPGTDPYTPERVRQVGYLSRLTGAAGFTMGVKGTWDWTDPTAGLANPLSTHVKHQGNLLRSLFWERLAPSPERVIAPGLTDPCDFCPHCTVPPSGCLNTGDHLLPNKCFVNGYTCSQQQFELAMAVDSGEAGTGNKLFALLYVPRNASFGTAQIDTAGLYDYANYRRRWFDPVAGCTRNSGTSATSPPPASQCRQVGNTLECKPPSSSQDWVLLLRHPSVVTSVTLPVC